MFVPVETNGTQFGELTVVLAHADLSVFVLGCYSNFCPETTYCRRSRRLVRLAGAPSELSASDK
jgi:hypothetical protein